MNSLCFESQFITQSQNYNFIFKNGVKCICRILKLTLNLISTCIYTHQVQATNYGSFLRSSTIICGCIFQAEAQTSARTIQPLDYTPVIAQNIICIFILILWSLHLPPPSGSSIYII